MNRYKLLNYTDVLGNAKDGYEVNDLCDEFNDLNIAEDAREKDILEYLKSIKFLTSSDRRKLCVEGLGGDMIEIFARKGMYPLGRLELLPHE